MKFQKTLFLSLGACFLLVTSFGAFAADAAKDAPPAQAWKSRCNEEIKDEGTKRGRCEVYQSLVVKESGKRFVEAAVSYPKGKEIARGVFVVPLGVLLQSGMQLKIDNGKPFKFQARYCDGNGCFGFVDLNEQILDTMRAGTKMTITFQTLNQKTVNVEMSLKDFSKTLKEVS